MKNDYHQKITRLLNDCEGLCCSAYDRVGAPESDADPLDSIQDLANAVRSLLEAVREIRKETK